jgi:misacylated tRNA(Ala) deacylase
MTELLYQTDSYLREFEAAVLAVDADGRALLLNRTVFYPGGGGQPADSGALSWQGRRFPVERARKTPEGVWHFLAPGADLPVADLPLAGLPPVGARLRGEIDWERRYQLMRTHTAMHILCGVVFRDYGALVTGGDMDPLRGRMDFEFENLSKDLVGVIEEAVNREVRAARAVHVRILPREEAFQIPDLIRTKINLLPPEISHIRTIELAGLDLQADGGTHVASTAEVGRMRVVDYKSKGRINKRIYVELDPL